MVDQASELRQLVRQHARLGTNSLHARPRLVTVSGGKGGVGTTTIAVNLAVALAAHGRRALLVDADPDRSDAATLCRIEEGFTVNDILTARRTVEEVIQPGPGGIHVLPGAWPSEDRVDNGGMVRRRLFQPLPSLGDRFDVVVVDAGNGATPIVRQAWQAADLVLLVATPELPAIMDAYASIKLLSGEEVTAPIHSLVNLAASPAVAYEVHGRLARACWRFLGITLASAGHLGIDPNIVAMANGGEPFVLTAEGAAVAGEFRQLADTVAAAAGSELRPRRASEALAAVA